MLVQLHETLTELLCHALDRLPAMDCLTVDPVGDEPLPLDRDVDLQ